MVGLLADPGVCTIVANRLVSELPAALSRWISDQVSWRVRVRSEAVALDADGEIPLADEAREIKPREGWDVLVCLTDLPQRAGTRPLIGCYSFTHGAAQVSLPANGWLRLVHTARDTVVRLVDEVSGEALDSDRMARDPYKFPRRPTELISPIRYVPSRQEGLDACLALVGARGKARLLLGMVRTNRPWRLVPGLSSATAAASAGGAFGIFFSNVWNLADSLSSMRLGLINVFAVTAMVVWLILYNNLWERPPGRGPRKLAVLYNVATVVTLSIGVACMYLVLFAVLLLGSVAVISGEYLQSTLGHPVGLGDYVSLVWLSSSMGTLAGALGSGLESEDAVRRATYSRREQERHSRRRREETGEEPEAEPAEEAAAGEAAADETAAGEAATAYTAAGEAGTGEAAAEDKPSEESSADAASGPESADVREGRDPAR